MRKCTKALAAATLTGGLVLAPAGAASAAPVNEQAGGAAGLIAAVVQLQDVDVTVIDGDVNVAVQNVLNRNRVLNNAFQNFLNENDIDIAISDVADVAILNGGVVIFN